MPRTTVPTDPACWFRELLGTADDDLERFRLEALRMTLRYCRDTVPYYREAFAGLPEPEALADLAAYPLLPSARIAAYRHPVLSEAVGTDFVVCSGGTSTQAFTRTAPASTSPKMIHRSFAEYPHLTAFRDWWYPRMGYGYSWDARPGDARYIIMEDEHGIRYIEPRRGPLRMLNFPLYNESHFHVARDVLTTHGPGDPSLRVSELRGTYRKVRLLTMYALEHGWNLAEEASVRRVVAAGFFTSVRWRALFKEAFGAELVQEYGLTEFHQGYANECLHCGAHHFAPIVVEEVVDPRDPARAVGAGEVGRLVLTHLYPTALRQVLVRYDSGDLVQVGDICDVVGARGYRPVGRLKNTLTVPVPDGELLLSTGHFIDAVDIPEAAFHVRDLLEHSHVTRFTDYGAPKFNIHLEDDRSGPVVRLDLELKKSLAAGAARRLRDRVEASLFRSHPEVRNRLEKEEFAVDVQLHEPGALTQNIPG
ncbi:hypothetical protein ACFQ9Z_34390 [Streptomyces sp. NPDC056580]|uniref:hypothetical protein n=1 Tax=Streptomyces sp. NPDC056580 TaxID=3345872 RepID=UPI00367822B9